MENPARILGMPLVAAAKDPIQLDAGKLALTAPLRTTLVVVAIVGVTLATGRTQMSIVMTLGALFTGIADPSDADGPRLRAMTATAVSCAVAALVGASVANTTTVHLIVAFAVAGACGYAGVLGARSALAGTLSLVLFIVFAGSSSGSLNAWQIGAFTAAGGAILIAVTVAPWVLARQGGARSASAIAYRNLSLAAAGSIAATSPSIADACAVARGAASRIGGTRRLRPWLVHIAELSHAARLGLMALAHTNPGTHQLAQTTRSPSPGEADPVGTAHSAHPVGAAHAVATAAIDTMHADAARLARQIARALVWPVRSRALATRVERLEQSRQMVIDQGAAPAVLVMATTAPLIDAARQVADPWPHGRDAHLKVTAEAAGDTTNHRSPHPWAELWARLAPKGRFASHAVRLAVAVTLATALTMIGEFPHEYWLPMTVAWMARPDLGGTLSRVGLRVVGTVVGVAATAAVFATFDPGTPGVTVLVGVGTLVAAMFIFVNYAVAVAGITVIVLALFSTSGESVSEDVGLRVAATVMAGVITLAIAFIRPERQADRLVSVLSATAGALHTYARAVLATVSGQTPHDPDVTGIDNARGQVLTARSNAEAVLTGAEHEPGAHGIEIAAGRELLTAMVDAAAELLAIELMQASSATAAPATTTSPITTSPTTTSPITTSPCAAQDTGGLNHHHVQLAEDLHRRLVALDVSGQAPHRTAVPEASPSQASPPQRTTALAHHLDRAHRVLDELPANASTPAAPDNGTTTTG